MGGTRTRGTGTSAGGGRAVAPGATPALALCALLSLALAACGSGDGDGAPDAPTSAVTGAPAPPTVSPAGYRQSLDRALKPVDAAVRAMNRANGGSAPSETFARASDAAGTAADTLLETPAPDDAATAHVRLATALRALSGSLEKAGTAHGRCVAPPRVALASTGGAAGLREASAALSGLGYPVRVALPRTERPQHRRLGNGTLVRDNGRAGLGRLTVDNGTSSDAVVSLTRGRSTAFSAYVRKGGSATVRAVDDGSYTVYVASGADWNPAKRSFTRGCVFQRFDDKAAFRTVAVTGGTQYTVLTYSLAKSLGGNAATSEVPEDGFPS
ncbi:hypothetical protein [Streptomyces corynorhini]|uniref:Lipoprotein n=1 Tax=Streptomyces corynorhini TaxID=2282652 RepID=A0A370BDX1_9ACTN|nr:hypothetical protein [Streptomyces corynorhini]RDG38444.1 hypothetical protein DVH02_09050 [Streptomyces corynorhini]